MSKTWNGFNVANAPDVTCGLGSYGVHWDEGVNNIGTDGRRRDWGSQLARIRPGAEESLEKRLGSLSHCILKIQGALDALDTRGDRVAEEPVDLFS